MLCLLVGHLIIMQFKLLGMQLRQYLEAPSTIMTL